ncbi:MULTISPECIES: hypothetical protein [Mycobacteroides]|jgi:hypothetical protein|uniref:hypothetical protein n=1 Tax=Mycobacteroides TaxID=670516 RepID=UPI0009943F87|nr:MULTISPECIES: hypothetical protein [Mycobacteroides]MDB2211759.1 hypothetical protein [Mycobacteroides abscessus subsp. massiliense]MDB2235391.1 hypothetical protein [Mycobacteroides abscessus subsp. massiliense]WJJ55575.1 hypothetical protein PROPHIT362_22 [Mycobacterium phage prophiT36-2a]SKR76841.1 Uncharacterised protein [Mycobacteroides abscessus subsp. abscessus]
MNGELEDVEITRDAAVYIGGKKLPGVIEANGITVTPGGAYEFNRLTVTFLVAKVDIEDGAR